MNRLFFYPKVDLSKVSSPNPYVNNMEEALSAHFSIVNRQYNKGGVIEFFKYLKSTDSYLFNWIEDLPIYRYGKMQVVFFVLFLKIAKLMDKRIIWILHNKYSHFAQKNFWTDLMYRLLVKNSDLILTHSNAGIEFVSMEYGDFLSHKVKYFPHPIEQKIEVAESDKKSYDLLIWGALHPYKGVVDFLEVMWREFEIGKRPRVLIVGKCFDKEYLERLNEKLSDGVVHIDEFKSLEEIAKYASTSKFVFFPYNSPSLLSSGTLMDSLRMGTKILGPNVGSFKDLSYLSNVVVYDDFLEIPSIISQCNHTENDSEKDLEVFFEDNSWKKFAKNFFEAYCKITKKNKS